MKADGLQAIMSSNMSLTRFVPKMSAGLSKSLLSKSAYPPALVVAGMSESDYCEGSTSCHMASLALASIVYSCPAAFLVESHNHHNTPIYHMLKASFLS